MNTYVTAAKWRAMFLCARWRIHSEGEQSLLEADEIAEQCHDLCVQPEGRTQTPSPTPSRELRKNSKSQLCLPLAVNTAAGASSNSASTSPTAAAPASSPRSRSLFTFAGARSGNSSNVSSGGVHSKAKRKQSRNALLMGSQQCKAGTSEPNTPNEPEHRASSQEVDEMRKAFVVCSLSCSLFTRALESSHFALFSGLFRMQSAEFTHSPSLSCAEQVWQRGGGARFVRAAIPRAAAGGREAPNGASPAAADRARELPPVGRAGRQRLHRLRSVHGGAHLLALSTGHVYSYAIRTRVLQTLFLLAPHTPFGLSLGVFPKICGVRSFSFN